MIAVDDIDQAKSYHHTSCSEDDKVDNYEYRPVFRLFSNFFSCKFAIEKPIFTRYIKLKTHTSFQLDFKIKIKIRNAN